MLCGFYCSISICLTLSTNLYIIQVTQLSNQELSSIEIQSNEAYSQSTSLQPQLSQDSHLVSFFCNKIFTSGSTEYILCKQKTIICTLLIYRVQNIVVVCRL